MLIADIEKPIGTEVTVVMAFNSVLLPQLYPDAPNTVTFTGKVAGRAEFDPPESIRITGDSNVPVRVIAFHKVIKWNDIDVTQPQVKMYVPSFKIIDGSKGKQYKLSRMIDGTITCTCPGFGFRKHCSHIDKFKDQL